MSKYRITHACGHDATVEIVGPVHERAGREKWLAGRPCRACWIAARREEERAAADAARAELAGEVLAVLEGSPKQVAWATDLRATTMLNVRGQLVYLRRDVEARGTDADRKAITRAEPALAAVAADQTSARWWIDRRRFFGPSAGTRAGAMDALREIVTWHEHETIRRASRSEGMAF